MSYTKRNWDCGDKITADALNHMEQGIYDGQNGYECEETRTLFFDGNITTNAVPPGFAIGNFDPLSAPITADSVKVTFNGTEYECTKVVDGDNSRYGAPFTPPASYDFSEYPFAFNSDLYSTSCDFCTDTAGTYSVKIESVNKTIETSECFEDAVKSIVDAGFKCVDDDIFDGQFTTTTADGKRADIPYDKQLDADYIVVNFNGTEYRLERTVETADVEGYRYGCIDSMVCDVVTPFKIVSGYNTSGQLKNFITTQNAGTFDVKITIPEGKVETTECFCKAVNSCVAGPLYVNFDHQSGNLRYYDKTWEEARDALYAGRMVIISPTGTPDVLFMAAGAYNGGGLYVVPTVDDSLELKADASDGTLYTGNI